MSKPYDQTRDPRTGRPPLPDTAGDRNPAGVAAANAKRDEQNALKKAVGALEETPEGDDRDPKGERPEALAQFAESSRRGEDSPKNLTADKENAPRRTSNKDKHEVATRILEEGAEGNHPDPHEEGVDKLPDRIVDRG